MSRQHVRVRVTCRTHFTRAISGNAHDTTNQQSPRRGAREGPWHRLTDALTAAACGGDLEPVLTSADAILAQGFYIGTRGESIAGMLYRLQLNDYDTGTSTADYFGLANVWWRRKSVRLQI